jgi:pimeloyl-ACP methyl ester carboxylesterase
MIDITWSSDQEYLGGKVRAKEPDEQGQITRDGVRIAWERFGDRGAWLLFVPTWHIVYSRSWKMQVAHLSRRFRVLTLDPRGNGASDRPASGYCIEDYAADALAVLDHHGAERAAVISAPTGSAASTSRTRATSPFAAGR